MGDLDQDPRTPIQASIAKATHHRPDRWQHPTTCQNSLNPLALKGASTDGKRSLGPGTVGRPDDPHAPGKLLTQPSHRSTGLDVEELPKNVICAVEPTSVGRKTFAAGH